MGASGFDQRKAPRVQIALNCFFWLAEDGAEMMHAARTSNLSETGVAFKSAKPLRKHDLLTLEIALPGQGRPLRLPARVIDTRFDQAAVGYAFEARCLFLTPGETERLLIRSALAPLLPLKISSDGMATALVEERQDPRQDAQLSMRYREVEDPEVGQSMDKHLYLDFETLLNSKYFPNMVEEFTENVSRGGLKVIVHKSMPEGRRLALELSLPSIAKPLRALAVVQWSMPLPEVADRYAMGMRFVAIRKDDALMMEAFVKKRKEGK